MKKASEVLGLKVIGIQEGQENGIAQDFMIDTVSKKVKYLILKSSNGYGFRVMNVTDVEAIGADYIITGSVQNTINIYESKEIMEEIEKGFFILGTTVLSSTGNIIGTVSDFSFEEKTGDMHTIILDDGNSFEADIITTLAGKMVFIDPEGNVQAAAPVEAVAELVEDVPEEIAVEAQLEPVVEVMPEEEPVVVMEPVIAVEEELIAEGPIVEEPVVEEEPVVMESVIPIEEEPVMDEPAVEEPVIEEEPAIVEEAPQRSALEQESIAFLLGKTVKSEVLSDDGLFRLEAGTELTEEIINLAEKHDAILTLTLSV